MEATHNSLPPLEAKLHFCFTCLPHPQPRGKQSWNWEEGFLRAALSENAKVIFSGLNQMRMHAPSYIMKWRLPRWLCWFLCSSHLSTQLLSLEMTLELFMFADHINYLAKSLKWEIQCSKVSISFTKCTLSNAINGSTVSLGPASSSVWGNNKDFSFSPLDHKCWVISAISALNQVASCLFFKMKLYFLV